MRHREKQRAQLTDLQHLLLDCMKVGTPYCRTDLLYRLKDRKRVAVESEVKAAMRSLVLKKLVSSEYHYGNGESETIYWRAK